MSLLFRALPRQAAEPVHSRLALPGSLPEGREGPQGKVPPHNPEVLAQRPGSKRTPTPVGVHTRLLDARHLSEADRQAWLALEARVLEPNINLSPYFVLPALRHLDPKLRVYLHVAECMGADGTPQCIGVALMHGQGPGRLFCAPHLGSYHCRHAFLGHWMLDRDHAEEAAVALLRQIRRRHVWATALTLPSSPVDGPQLPVMQAAAARLGLALAVVGVKTRAVLVPADGGPDKLKQQLRKQYSNVERCRRRLEEQGTLSWRLLRGELPASAIDDFLTLEHSGWKRESGTSLRAQAGDEAFFREMTQGFASQGRALFTELRLNDRVIASTCNYVSGSIGYAFKVGWEDEFRKYGIGIFNEAELVRRAPQLCGDLQYIDSGSQPASFIEMLWAGRRQVGTLVLPLGPVGRLVWRAQVGLRQLGARVRGARGGGAAGSPDAGVGAGAGAGVEAT